nr:hypothetical protein [Tanacetum cinerariifolium]
MVAKDDKTSKDKEIGKLMALISLSFKKIYKPTNNNLRTSSNTSRENQDNSPRINRSTGYENQRIGNVVGARETVGSTVVQKSGIQCYNCKEFRHVAMECQKPKRVQDAAYHREKMLLCKQEEAGIQLNTEQADWSDDTDDDELEDQELKAHYIEEIDQNDDDNDLANECVLLASLIEKLKCEIDESKNQNKFLETSNKVLVEKLKGEIEDFKNKNKSLESSNNRFKEANNKLSETNNLMYTDFKKSKAELARRNNMEYASKMKIECAQKTQFLNEIDRLSREYYYVDHMNAILGVYTELDEVTNLQYLKAQLQDKGIVISELKKLIEKLKGKSVDTKFEKSSVIRQPNTFKSQRPSVLGKPTTFSNSFERKDFSKSKSVTQNNVSNDFSKPVTAQTLPPNKKSILKNTNVLAPGMYKLHTDHNQARTSQLPQDSRKTNKHVSFSIGVIPTTSISRPQLKSNPMGDRVMRNNSQGKKQEVEDQRRNVKFSKNKTSVTACNDSLNAKTNKPRNITRKIYERISKACSWWYPKFTPSGYKWKPKSEKENVNPNLVEIVLFIIESRNDQIAHILGYGDLVQGAVTIKRVYYVEGLNHNLFSVGQFCDADLDVTFRKSKCYIRNLKGNDLLTENDIVVGLPKLKFIKDHLCSSCELGKAKRKSFHTKITPSSKRRLQLLHMDLCGPMRVASINGKRYVLVIVDDYSRYTWTHFLRFKDETPETLHVYIAAEGILHQMSVARTPEQNGVVERRNRTLVEAARTMLSAAKVPLFFWAEAIATAYGENLDKMKEKGYACIFMRYSTQSRAYRVFNKRTRVIVESIHVNFDELPQMASDHVSSDLAPEYRTVTTSNELDLLFSPMFDELLNGSSKVVSKYSTVSTADAPNQHHPLEQLIGNPSQSIRTRRQLESDGEMCMFALTVSQTEPMNIKEAMADSAWIESMQEELHQFDRLEMDVKTTFLYGPLKEEVYVN